MVFFFLYPLLSTLWFSLHRYHLARPSERPFIGVLNYVAVFQDSYFWVSVKATIYFLVVAVSIEMILGLAIAVLLNQKFRGRGFVRALLIIPWAVPAVVNGVMWKWIYNPSFGALNGLLETFGLIDKYIVWLGHPFLALNMLVIADVWKETPFIVLIILAALQTIPESLYEAAKVDGANAWQSFRKITLAVIRPTLFVALSLRTIWAVKNFDLVYTLTQGGPSRGTSLIAYYMYVKSFVSLTFGYGAAVACIITIVIFIIIFFYQRALTAESFEK